MWSKYARRQLKVVGEIFLRSISQIYLWNCRRYIGLCTMKTILKVSFLHLFSFPFVCCFKFTRNVWNGAEVRLDKYLPKHSSSFVWTYNSFKHSLWIVWIELQEINRSFLRRVSVPVSSPFTYTILTGSTDRFLLQVTGHKPLTN